MSYEKIAEMTGLPIRFVKREINGVICKLSQDPELRNRFGNHNMYRDVQPLNVNSVPDPVTNQPKTSVDIMAEQFMDALTTSIHNNMEDSTETPTPEAGGEPDEKPEGKTNAGRPELPDDLDELDAVLDSMLDDLMEGKPANDPDEEHLSYLMQRYSRKPKGESYLGFRDPAFGIVEDLLNKKREAKEKGRKDA